jgi:intracellular multiplication protein IcmK
VSLQGASKPIAFMVIAGTGSYDADLTARISARGPNAQDLPTQVSDAPTTGAAFLTQMLDGAPPAAAVPLQVSGVSADRMRAWRMGDNMYLRTEYRLVSPAPIAQESEYGTTIYQIPETSEVLVASAEQLISVSLSEPGP